MRNEVNLLPTPFTERLKAFNLNHSWERWEGFLSVGAFDNVVREYFAIRNAVSVYDISPMTRYRITGAQATDFMDRVMTRDMAKCRVGQAAYVVWCNDHGKVVEDGTAFRLGERDYLINVQEHNLCWFQDTAWRMDVAIEDVSRDYAGLTVQGPLSRELLRQVGIPGIETLKFFRLAQVELDGIPLLVSRTGFTGDLGYEVALPPGHAEGFWDRLWRTQIAARLVPIGSHALNYARIEAGFLQVNTDFIGAENTLRPSQRRSPFELGLDWLVDLKKPFFVGRRALLKEKESGGPQWRTVGLDIAGNKPAVDSFLYSGNKEVGRVTSAFWSPICKRNIAIATVKAGYDTLGTELQADIWFTKELKIEKNMMPARVVPRPFYDPPHKKV